ncbi:hypothetical protein L5515_011946 [Caenorhabditis briggsae]|uniref:BZIP domain-containing protein n=1 Tax=Caenorhabditis briggsae TaxID=6238 RepID=A0AAE9ERA9_CAEBR|nr:hypothetical protein L5515_011946 [Caenorhabditis briggsae]
MWPPVAEDHCNYSYQEHAALNPHDHYHHHHYPHSSAHHLECYQTLSCPSDLPVETSYYNTIPPTYQDLGQTDLSPQFWCAEVDCAHERCAKKDIPHEQSKIFEEISKECDHILNNSEECDKCKIIQHEDGAQEAIPINDLVDIVMQTVDNLKKNEPSQVSEETKMLSRKREQNKVAAARYRDKQKAKWQDLLDKREVEEKRNVRLKKQVEKLEKEVAEARQAFLQKVTQK